MIGESPFLLPPMLLWALLLTLAAAKKAVVIPNPPWTPVFTGEKVTLTCNGSHLLDPNTVWQVYGRQWHKTSRPLEVTKTGEYRCQTEDSSLSKPVYVVFSKDVLILQILYTVFEGDTLLLKCRGQNDIQLTEISYYKDKKSISGDNENSMFSIPHASSSHNGVYYCKAKANKWYYRDTSREAKLQVQELFAPPELKTTTSEPTEGTPVTLSCETQLPPQRSDTKLHLSFFREGRIIASDWKESQVLQIPAIWREDSGLYWCEAKAMTQNIWKQSNHVKISVKGIPISGILMETEPSGGQVTEGEKLVLICSVAQGTGNITFSWHREGINTSLGEKTQRSLEEKFVLSAVNENDAGKYYCTANNGISTFSSQKVNVTVKRRSLFSKESSSKKIGHLALGLIVTQFILVVLSASALLLFFGPWSKPDTPWRHCGSSSRPPQ